MTAERGRSHKTADAALRRVNLAFTTLMMEHGIPIEGVLCELFLSGEMERTYRLLRLEGYARQMEHHSPTSQYGQLSRAEAYASMDVETTMRALVDDIVSGRFADEWDAERDAGHARLAELKAAAVGDEMLTWERELRTQLGELAARD